MTYKRDWNGIQNRFCMLMVVGLLIAGCSTNSAPEWPEITQENKPWTRWWWMGSAVNEQDLTQRMEQYQQSNIGGLELTPIYGVYGYEDQFIDFLSPTWMDRLEYTLAEGERLDLGIDIATGTGWPFGGPWIKQQQASKRLYFSQYEINGGQQVAQPISYRQQSYLQSVGNTVYELHNFLKAEGENPEGTPADPIRNPESDPIDIFEIQQPISANENLQELALAQIRFEKQLPLAALMAYSAAGDTVELTERVDENGMLKWEAPAGSWTLYAVFDGWHGKMVERAAPGGEGLVLDHFSEEALQHYLARFDSAFAGRDISSLRSFFNDSYEVDDAEGQANWTPQFFEEFEQRRGYDLKNHLPALLEGQNTEIGRRVLTDYRETISDLLLEEFTRPWDAWADENDALIRNQAHGSPANILDLYAASDIPETEGTDILRAKMASSAGNVTGKPLIAAEAATWLNEHFRSNLADVKEAVDRYFLSGVNHVVYHGTAYSPSDDPWPGWLFYAAVHFNERNPFWDHFADFNQYVARTQSFLQKGSPYNDVLLYYSIHDQWATPGGGLLRHFDGGLEGGFEGTHLKQAAEQMLERGYSFDFISDRQLGRISYNDGELMTEGASYQTIVVPQSRYIPLESFQKLTELARQGADILFAGGLPSGVPGFVNLESRSEQFNSIISELQFTGSDFPQMATLGEGRVFVADQLGSLLQSAGVEREPMVDQGLRYVRRTDQNGTIYFITNWGEDRIDGWVPIVRATEAATIFDPMQKKAGTAMVRSGNQNQTEVYLQLQPGESLILKTGDSASSGPLYAYSTPAGSPVTLQGEWELSFDRGGPELPPTVTLDSLTSWTTLGDDYARFSGTGRYSIEFTLPENHDGDWSLNLGEIHESATVFLNGEKLGTLVGPVFEMQIEDEKLQQENTLQVEVANSMANRIIWMEQQEEIYKKFYNVNFPAYQGQNRNRRGLFTASDWQPEISGLLGPVTLTPVHELNQN